MSADNENRFIGANPLEDEQHTVDGRMASGAIWMVLARICDKSIGLVGTLIVARLLAPSDFGLIAMAAVVVELLELLSSFGFDVALIQRRDPTRSHFDTAWTLNILLGLLIALCLVLSSNVVPAFFNEPRLEAIILCLAIPAVVRGFHNVGTVLFRKNLQFKKEFRFLLLKRIGVFATTVSLAIVFRSYWALVLGNIAGSIIGLFLSFLLHPYRPRFSLSAAADLFGFGKWLVISNSIAFASQRFATIILGKLGGAYALGVFSVSYDLSTLISSELVAPINRAVFPGFAKKSHDLRELRRSYLEVIGIVIAVTAPAAIGLAAVADLVVPLVLGMQWLDAVPIMEVLAVFGLLSVLTANGYYVYLALGRPRIAMWLGLFNLAILAPAVTIGVFYEGAIGASLGYLSAQIILTPVSLAVLSKVLGLDLRGWAREVYRPFIAAIIMYFLVRTVHQYLAPSPEDTWLLTVAFLACVLAGICSYLVVLYLVWRFAGRPVGAESKIVTYVNARVFTG